MNINFMREALGVARTAASHGETPIGALIVRDDEIIVSAHNLTESLHDATAHAEMLTIREASRILGTRYLTNCDFYVTLEPCPMCAQAIAFARIRKLVFGAYDPKGGGVEHGPRIFNQPTCHHRPEVIGGVMEQECGELLRGFFKERR
jgi:tRNA(adenine34) deaminase